MPMSSSEGSISDLERQFHLEEYKTLRAELLSKADAYDRLKLISVGALGALYAWTVSNLFMIPPEGSALFKKAAICVKFSTTAVCATMVIALAICGAVIGIADYMLRHFDKLGQYLRRLEQTLGDGALGWEAFLHPETSSRRQYGLRAWGDGFWVWLLLGCVVFSGAVIWYSMIVGPCF